MSLLNRAEFLINFWMEDAGWLGLKEKLDRTFRLYSVSGVRSENYSMMCLLGWAKLLKY